MKAKSNNVPEPIQYIGKNKYYVNMNVTEVGEAPNVSYEYDYVKTEGYPTYGGTVDLLIREKYSESDELAILRQRDTKPEAFSEYNTFCESCKDKARPVFFPNEQGG